MLPSLEIVVWVATGGRGTLVGAILAAIGINAARSLLTARYPSGGRSSRGLFVGVVMVFPDGLAGLPGQLQRWGRRLRWRRRRLRPPTIRCQSGFDGSAVTWMCRDPEWRHRVTQHGSIVYLEGVSVTFDGFQALRGVNLYVDHGGSVRSSARTAPAKQPYSMSSANGQARHWARDFRDTTDLSVLESYQIAALGIGRKFQTPSVFKHLTLLENLMLSLPQRWDLWSTLFGAPTGATDQMASILESLGLLEKAHRKAGSLSHGRYNGWRSVW